MNPRTRRFSMLHKSYKAFNSYTFPDKIPPGRPIIVTLASFTDNFIKPPTVEHPYIK